MSYIYVIITSIFYRCKTYIDIQWTLIKYHTHKEYHPGDSSYVLSHCHKPIMSLLYFPNENNAYTI